VSLQPEVKICIQGYLIGNGATDMGYDYNSFVPFAHGMGLISTEFFEVFFRRLIYAQFHFLIDSMLK
jgi:hypothetical protein